MNVQIAVPNVYLRQYVPLVQNAPSTVVALIVYLILLVVGVPEIKSV